MIRRKTFFIVPFFLVTIFNAAFGQTLFTYGNKSVTSTEFLKAYGKNNTIDKPTEQTYRDYLDLYTKFKIKVQAAVDMKLDTLGSLKAELQNFRSQIAQSFLNDEESMQTLIDEAFSRSQKDIHVAHIFIPVQQDDSLSVVKEAESRIHKAYEALKQHSFEKVALEYSQDPSVKINKGDIGFITVFVLPYTIENIVYSMPAGQYSKPVRSASGFHILKNLGERKAVGRIRVAQILLAFPPEASKSTQDAIGRKADSIVKLLQNGASFKELALQLSSDNLSYQNGGELPEFGVGRYDQPFESAAFSLRNDGEVSKPVRTEFGYHILKRIAASAPPQDKANEQWRDNTRQSIQQNDRMAISQKQLLKNIQQKTGYRKLPFNQKNLWRLTDSVLANKKVPAFTDLNTNTGLFAFSKQTLKVRDWENYLESVKGIPSLVSGKSNTEIFDQFVETSTLEYYRDHLEEFNPEFVAQLKEFREGNLLFEVMQRKIWDPAAQDTIALRNFYQKNSNKYWWEVSANAIIFTSADEKTAEVLKSNLKTNLKDWRTLADTSNGSIQADSGRFELGQIPVVERTNFTEGLITANVKNETDKTVTFAYIIKMHNGREVRSFADAKGFVINDYQLYLEEKWIADLKKKYPLKINETVFNSLPK